MTARSTDRAKWTASTPAGTYVAETESSTEAGAWEKLLKATAHMPYGSIEALKARGYTVDLWEPI
jgi:hypothetical protein